MTTAALALLLLQATPTWDFPATSTEYWRRAFGTGTASSPGAADTAEAHAWASQAAHARGTAVGWPSPLAANTATPTVEPTPTLVPTASDTPRPYTPSGPTPTLVPRPRATRFAVTPRPTSTHPTRTATASATETPKAGPRRVRLFLPLAIAPYRRGVRTW